jgi:hypothetical protein
LGQKFIRQGAESAQWKLALDLPSALSQGHPEAVYLARLFTSEKRLKVHPPAVGIQRHAAFPLGLKDQELSAAEEEVRRHAAARYENVA